jgi:hypothetical protein
VVGTGLRLDTRFKGTHTGPLAGGRIKAGPYQGLTLVHFSAQPKPFWSHLPVSLSNRLAKNHAPNVFHTLCLS